MNTATLSTSNRIDPGYRERPFAVEGDADARNDNQQPATDTVVFSMLLDVARSIYIDSSQLTTTSPTSAMQMFEPNASDRDARRQSMMQQPTRADQLRDGVGYGDRSSVQARRIGHDQLSEMESPLKNARTMNSESKLHSLATLANKSSQSTQLEMSKLESPQPIGKNHSLSSTEQQSTGLSDTRLDFKTMRSAEMTSPAHMHQVSSTSAAAGVRSATGSKMSSSPIAQQVGQVLATGRGGEVESARAVQAAQPTTNAQPKSSNSKPGANTLTPSSRDANSSSLIETKDDSVSRSEFDQLVRSIRMKPGLWQSSAKIRLDPPSLGTLNVDVRLVGKKIEIIIKTESLEATERISQQASKLISALEQQGIAIERFDVSMEEVTQDASQESESSQADASAQHHYESTESSAQNSNTGEVVELSDPQIDNAQELELNPVAERRIDIKV